MAIQYSPSLAVFNRQLKAGAAGVTDFRGQADDIDPQYRPAGIAWRAGLQTVNRISNHFRHAA